jgi:hypothetical protein
MSGTCGNGSQFFMIATPAWRRMFLIANSTSGLRQAHCMACRPARDRVTDGLSETFHNLGALPERTYNNYQDITQILLAGSMMPF